MTINQLKEICEELIMDGKGNYIVVVEDRNRVIKLDGYAANYQVYNGIVVHPSCDCANVVSLGNFEEIQP